MTTIACSTLAFARRPLEEALAGAASLGFRAVDLAVLEGWAHVDPSWLAAGGARRTASVARLLARHGLHAVALNVGLGDAHGGELGRRLDAVLGLAEALGSGLVTLQAPPSGTDVAAAATELRQYAQDALGRGVVPTVETHVGQVTERPEIAVRVAEAVPGLELTLDPSHYYAGLAGGHGFECVYPYVRHLHVRDAGYAREQLQVDFGAGEIDFRRLLADLRAVGYKGAASIEYIEDDTDVTAQVLTAKSYLETTVPAP